MTVITVNTEKDLSMKYLKIGIPDDLHPKFKGYCASINSSMQGRIVELIANDVNNGNTVYEVDTVTVDTVDTTYIVDTVDKVEAVDTVNDSPDLKTLIEGLNNKLDSIDDRLHNVESRKKPKLSPNYKPEVLEIGHMLNQNQLTKRLSDYKLSQNKGTMGRGTIGNHRKDHSPEAHKQWLKERDPHGLIWDYNEEKKIYTVIENQESLD